MAENSKIQWTDHTFNPWRGCTKVSAGCQNCYADTQAKRNPKVLGIWGPNGTRVVASEAMWREPLKWDRDAEKAGERRRVFCASMADVFEDWSGRMTASNGNPMWWCNGSMSNSPVPAAWNGVLEPGCRWVTMDDIRERLFFLIRDTPNLDWLLLTKRPECILGTFGRIDAHDVAEQLPNIWLGTTVENQEQADARIPHLLEAPAAVHFLSCEPLLGPVDLQNLDGGPERCRECGVVPQINSLHLPNIRCECCVEGAESLAWHRLDWVIVGGESGHQARPMQLAWARSLVEQCQHSDTPVFVKQLGALVHATNIIDPLDQFPGDVRSFRQGPGEDTIALRLLDDKGGDPAEWPLDLRVREFPKVAA